MKKLVLLFLLISGIVFMSCTKSIKDQIVGKWKIESIGNQTLSDSEKQTVFEFKSDGSATNSSSEEPAKWEVVDDKHIVIKTSNGKEEKFENVQFEGDKMSFTIGNEKVVMKKI